MYSVAGLFIAFFMVVFLLYKKFNMGLSLIFGSLLVGLTSAPNLGESLSLILPTLLEGLTAPMTLELLMIIGLVTIMAYIMDKNGLLEGLLTSLSRVLPYLSLNMIAIPSIIGALFIPGGAMISAPVIKPIGEQMGMNETRMTSVNIFFRHLWYFIFPYQPTLLLASSMTGLGLFTIAFYQLPVVVLMLVTGYLFFFKGAGKITREEDYNRLQELKNLFICLLPLLVAILIPILFDVSFIIALFLGLLITILLRSGEFKWLMLWRGLDLQLLFALLGIMIFKSFIDQTPAVDEIAGALLSWGFSPLLLALILSFLIGLLTGNHISALAICYPLLLPFFNEGDNMMMVNLLLFSFSFFGYLISPFHLCIILTVEYYRTSLLKVYRDLALPIGITLLGVLLFSLYYGLML